MTRQLVGRAAGSVYRDAGTPYLERLFVADTWWTRFRGLQFVPELPEDTGLILVGCRSVHTFWMRFPIHVIFLDAQRQVLECRPAVPPWRAVLPRCQGVDSVLEVAAGTEIPEIGERLAFDLGPPVTGH